MTIYPRLADVRGGDNPCGYCAGKRVHPYAARLLMVRRAGVIPVVPYRAANDPWPSMCLKHGHSVQPSCTNVKHGYTKQCSRCAPNAPYTPAEAVLQAVRLGLLPDDDQPYPGISNSWRGFCIEAGHLAAPSLGNLLSGQGPCGECSSNGFSIDRPGYLYAVYDEANRIAKPGISNNLYKRLGEHRLQGFGRIFGLVHFGAGSDARNAEWAIQRMIRERYGPRALVREDMRYGGHTETVAVAPDLLEALWTDIVGVSCSFASARIVADIDGELGRVAVTALERRRRDRSLRST